MVNAQKLYNMHHVNQNLKPLTLLSYTIQVCESLTGIDRSTDFPSTSSNLPFTRANFHRCEQIDPTRPKLQPNCVVCTYKSEHSLQEPSKKRIKRTVYECPMCKVSLCFGDCFTEYHTQEKYR